MIKQYIQYMWTFNYVCISVLLDMISPPYKQKVDIKSHSLDKKEKQHLLFYFVQSLMFIHLT